MRASIVRLAFIIFSASWMTGCGNIDIVKPIKDLVPVEGAVNFDGKPLDQGSISFAPMAPNGQSATGEIKNGHFRMSTTASASGVVIGKYRVRVISDVPLGPPDSSDQQIPLSQRKIPEPESRIPKKYNDFETSGLEIDVKKGMAPVEFDLELER